MVKADAKQNYYQLLEVPPTADTEEIKRAFRKLGVYTPSGQVRPCQTDNVQPEYTTPIAILGKRMSLSQSFKLYKRHTRSSAILTSGRNMTPTGGSWASGV